MPKCYDDVSKNTARFSLGFCLICCCHRLFARCVNEAGLRFPLGPGWLMPITFCYALCTCRAFFFAPLISQLSDCAAFGARSLRDPIDQTLGIAFLISFFFSLSLSISALPFARSVIKSNAFIHARNIYLFIRLDDDCGCGGKVQGSL